MKKTLIFPILILIAFASFAYASTTEIYYDFEEGWNLFSFCSNLGNPNLVDVLSSIDGKYRYVMRWNLTDQSFNIYSPKAIQKPFDDFDDNSSYFIYMFEEASLNVVGQEAVTEERNLVEGWNTPAYQYRFPTLITTMISGIINNFRYIMKWDTASQEFIIYSKRSENKPFNEIFPGEGRFIYMEDKGTIEN